MLFHFNLLKEELYLGDKVPFCFYSKMKKSKKSIYLQNNLDEYLEIPGTKSELNKPIILKPQKSKNRNRKNKKREKTKALEQS